jgi:hypothetical protein
MKRRTPPKKPQPQPRPGWAPDPPMVGIRSPIGLVVGSCTSHPAVLGSIPKREEPGKTGAPCIKVPGSSQVPPRLTQKYYSLARLPPTHPFVGAPILQRHFQVASSSLTHARRMDGFCNQNADQLGSLAGQSLLTVYVGVVECAPASLPPASSSLTHARRMDGFCNQNADQLCYLAGQSLLTVYVGVVECAPASPFTYSSSTHRFPDERTPIEATPLSATSAELRLGLGLGLGLDSLSHSSSHALPFFSPPSFHTLSLSPTFTSVWWSA